MRIVKFENGTYGLRVGNWFTGYSFISVAYDWIKWKDDDDIIAFCQFNEEQLEERLKKKPKLNYKVME
tara:strand:+ start:353 stop:556 length:204 start_codon:yes stop_codon:yes gene_type:complete